MESRSISIPSGCETLPRTDEPLRQRTSQAGLADSTIASYLAHLRAALRTRLSGAIWRDTAFPRQQRVRGAKTMKGRPITGEEFERMLANVEAIVGVDARHHGSDC